MSEFSVGRDVIIDGRAVKGRTYQREDGTYESLDLKDVRPGEVVTVLTDDGVHELTKWEAAEQASAMEGWRLGPKVVRLSLSEPAGNGASFIHRGIVLRERLGVGVIYPESDRPNVVHSLGTVATIVGRRREDDAGQHGEMMKQTLDS